MTDATAQMTPFKYVLPQTDRPKKIMWLGRTDRLFATMQVINKGGETNLHSHSHLDGFWFVLGGRGRFYSDETTVACELGPNEGVLVPRGVKYWFESIGDQPLELIQVECSDIAMKTNEALMADRHDFTPLKRAPSGIEPLETAKT